MPQHWRNKLKLQGQGFKLDFLDFLDCLDCLKACAAVPLLIGLDYLFTKSAEEPAVLGDR